MSRVLATNNLRGAFISVRRASVLVGDVDTMLRDPVLKTRDIERCDAISDLAHLARARVTIDQHLAPGSFGLILDGWIDIAEARLWFSEGGTDNECKLDRGQRPPRVAGAGEL